MIILNVTHLCEWTWLQYTINICHLVDAFIQSALRFYYQWHQRHESQHC